MINEVRLMGFFGADPEERETNGGEYKYARFPLSLYRRSTNRDVRGNFIQCEAWNRTGEIVKEMGKKGSRAIIEGELRVDLWKGENDETRSRTTYIRVNRIIFVDQRGNSNSDNSNNTNANRKNTSNQGSAGNSSSNVPSNKSEKDDEFESLFDGFDF